MSTLGCIELSWLFFWLSLYFTFLLKNFRPNFFRVRTTLKHEQFVLSRRCFFVAPAFLCVRVRFRWFNSSLSAKAIFSLQLTELLVCFHSFYARTGHRFFSSARCARSKQNCIFRIHKNTNTEISSSQKHCSMRPKFYERWWVCTYTQTHTKWRYFSIDFGDNVTFYR